MAHTKKTSLKRQPHESFDPLFIHPFANPTQVFGLQARKFTICKELKKNSSGIFSQERCYLLYIAESGSVNFHYEQYSLTPSCFFITKSQASYFYSQRKVRLCIVIHNAESGFALLSTMHSQSSNCYL